MLWRRLSYIKVVKDEVERGTYKKTLGAPYYYCLWLILYCAIIHRSGIDVFGNYKSSIIIYWINTVSWDTVR